MRSVSFFHTGQWKLKNYLTLLRDVNLVSSLVKVYVHPVAMLGLTFARISD
jgi:hypothetical protein